MTLRRVQLAKWIESQIDGSAGYGIQRQSLNEKTLGFGRPVEHENPKETCVSTRADIRPENAESSTVIIIIVTFPETNTFRQPI